MINSPSNLLQDARFWARILKEHALFIQLGLPCDRSALIAEAEDFVEHFQALQDQLEASPVLTPLLRQQLIQAVAAIIQFKRRLIRMMVQCELASSLYPLLVDHITREAMFFLELLLKPSGDQTNTLRVLLSRHVFWLRIMKEHIEFVRHLLDPSQRTLIEEADRFKEIFSRLLETARDLQSMAESRPQSFNTVLRFTTEVMTRTMELRDFKAAAHELALLCQLLSTVPDPLLLDHIRREADKFLEEINDLMSILRETQLSATEQ